MDQPAEIFPLTVEELMQQYNPVKPQIEARLMDFRHIWETASDEELFLELVFCLLTPQSKAKTCWKAVERLEQKCMIAEAAPAQISQELGGVRFHQRKGEYICLARNMFSTGSLRARLAEFADAPAARQWLVENVKGLGYKEASHFLRNIGLGEDLGHLRPAYSQESGPSRRDKGSSHFSHEKDLPGDREKDDCLFQRSEYSHGPP